MPLTSLRSAPRLLLGGLLLACGCEPTSPPAAGESPGTHEAALCSGLTVTPLTITGASSYQFELAGGGSWTVSTGANAVRLEYSLGGVLQAVEERTGASGTWYFSGPMACGTQTFQVKAYPMVIDSGGNRTTCYTSSTTASQSVTQSCGAIVGGGTYSFTLKADGTVKAWGNNGWSSLGDGTTAHRFTPVKLTSLSGPTIALSAAGGHAAALKLDGTVWTWGYNPYGQLGDGTTLDRSSPVQVPNLTNVVAIATGTSHTLALKKDGTVWAWGRNQYGQLGDGTTTSRLTPVQVTGLGGITAIAGGLHHSLALRNDGTVRAWGNNAFGQLGDGTSTQRLTPVTVPGLSGVGSIGSGNEHSLAVLSDGTVRAWGHNGYGSLGDGTTTHRSTPVTVSGLSGITAVTGGTYHSAALKSDGTVRAWGYNSYGQLCDGTRNNRLTPYQPTGLTGVLSLDVGNHHTLALKSDGTARACGNDIYGQLGDGSDIDRLTPVSVVGL